MSVILYLPQKEKKEDDLLRIIQKAIPVQNIEICSSICELSERLRQPMMNVSAAVLYAASRAELMEIIYLNDLLNDLKVVLVLPDSDPEVLEKAYILCPRFIAVAESDFKHLGSVLKKMTNLYDKVHGA
ncbi:MAG: hypothetical protein LLG40_04750 [Deltaproteobacteria bacterium]|nr:hypothetical protein [Deltaproteobacteria bacterium]